MSDRVPGSFASAFHGKPRSTQDIDLVIAPTMSQLTSFVRALSPSEYYVNEAAALEAFRDRGLFNVVDLSTGWKIDFILRKDREYSVVEFDRRTPQNLRGIVIQMARAEDVVLSKLEWAKLGESERQLNDVRGILEVRGASLDRRYIEAWLDDLGVRSLWERAQQ